MRGAQAVRNYTGVPGDCPFVPCVNVRSLALVLGVEHVREGLNTSAMINVSVIHIRPELIQ